ncbi:MAG: hypothetical protein GKC10_09555 [Methanosarcinales archaeon]|nr:hypothetical protein [Methanosarcinales archaeon]
MRPILLLILVLLAAPLAGGYIYHIPKPTLLIHSSVSPEVLMPGDTGVLTVEIENGAGQYVVQYQDEDFTLSTPINRTWLEGSEDIQVTSQNYRDIGMIGPGDSVPLYFTIKVDQNISEGTHFLDFGLSGGYDLEEINRKIPIQIDANPLTMVRSEVPKSTTISLDVANPRQNTVNAVTVTPRARGWEFSPEEYYIGTMEADELFTIEFDLQQANPENKRAPEKATNITFSCRFKNGETWHQSANYTIPFQPAEEQAPRSPWVTLALGAVVLAAGAGLFIFIRRRRSPGKRTGEEASDH